VCADVSTVSVELLPSVLSFEGLLGVTAKLVVPTDATVPEA